METKALTPAETATRRAVALLKQSVKDDATAIRALKAERARLAKAQDPKAATAQYDLYRRSYEARARLLAYGLARGHAWNRMEINRPEGDPDFAPNVRRAWQAVHAAVTKETGTEPEMSAALRSAVEVRK